MESIFALYQKQWSRNNHKTMKFKTMKIHHFRWIGLLASISTLLNYRPSNAYDDSDFLRGWKNAKVNRKGRSLDGIFRDFPQESDPAAQENDVIEESVSIAEEFDVTPAVVGGTEVNPRRKYKVRYHFLWEM